LLNLEEKSVLSAFRKREIDRRSGDESAASLAIPLNLLAKEFDGCLGEPILVEISILFALGEEQILLLHNNII
jgi:hypothetical protein